MGDGITMLAPIRLDDLDTAKEGAAHPRRALGRSMSSTR